MIPKCRPWRVRYVRDDKTIKIVEVNAINRRFAIWNANDLVSYAEVRGCDIKVSRPRKETK